MAVEKRSVAAASRENRNPGAAGDVGVVAAGVDWSVG
jgi:hypothetical protein